MNLPLSQPGTLVGNFTKEIQEEVGFDCKVILVATHDTGSAVMAVPTESDECLYISSGTWSLMGIENQKAICHEENIAFPSRVDVNHETFLAPDHMQKAIKEYCRKSGQQVPESIGEMATVIYQSLAESYAETAKEIEAITGKSYDIIHIVGGGSNATYLNKLTAEKAKRKVLAGPSEATAIGNLMAQMIENKVFTDLKAARRCVYESFEMKAFN